MKPSTPSASKNKQWILVGSLVGILCVFGHLAWTHSAMSFQDVTSFFLGSSSQKLRTIFLFIRIPRVTAAYLCGAALSVSGLVLQTSLNNPLASASVLGINHGSGLFVLAASLLLPTTLLTRNIMALLGALCAMALLIIISKKTGSARSTLILIGVAISSLMSAGINILITIWPHSISDKVSFQLGGFQSISLSQVLWIAPLILASLLFVYTHARGLDLLKLGDESAHGLGLDVQPFRMKMLVVASILAAASVSLCGLLSFVGLIIPNVIRSWLNPDTKAATVLCTVWGGAFLVVCDGLARALFYPYELPVGILLSCLGAPFFLVILMQRKRRSQL